MSRVKEIFQDLNMLRYALSILKKLILKNIDNKSSYEKIKKKKQDLVLVPCRLK